MLKSEIVSSLGATEAAFGDTISYVISIKNTGDEAGWFLLTLWYQEEDGQVGTHGDYRWLDAGEYTTWNLSLVMPARGIDIWVASFHWDYTIADLVVDDQEIITHVTLTVPVVEEKADPKLVSFTIDDQVVAGAQVRAIVGLRNEGTGRGWCRPLLWWRLGGQDYEAFPPNVELDPGESLIFDIYFTMPDATIQVMVVAQWYDFDTRIWWASDEKGPFTVAVISDPWPHLDIPPVIVTFLGYFNWPKRTHNSSRDSDQPLQGGAGVIPRLVRNLPGGVS